MPSPDLPLDLPDYPGRGIVLVRSPAGLEWAYFVTGRSSASRARRFVAAPGSLFVSAADDVGEADPLRHYRCAAELGSGGLVLGNGDHVDVIVAGIDAGRALDEVAEMFAPEPDPPIHTPRIAAVAATDRLQILTVRRGAAGSTIRTIEHRRLEVGDGIVVHTYSDAVDGPQGSAPVLHGRIDPHGDLAVAVWSRLAAQTRVMACAGTVPSARATSVVTAD